MSSPGGFLLFAAIAVLVIVGAIWQYQRDKKRRAALRRLALGNHWTYVAEDDSQWQRWSRAPFNEGFDRRARNVMWGKFRNHDMLAFDYSYKTQTTDSKGNTSTQTHRYRVAALALPTWLPYLHVGPENVLTRLGNAIGIHDINLESEDFNRRFRVHANDPKFAYDVLSPRTIQKLLSLPTHEWSIDGATVVSWQRGVTQVADLLGRLSTLVAVVDGIPDFVWHDHGVTTGPPGMAADGSPGTSPGISPGGGST